MKIVQITDMHLYGDPTKTLWDVNTQLTFKAVLAHATNKEKPDLIVLTGDLSDDASIGSYQDLAATINKIGIPTYCIGGNHDQVTFLAGPSSCKQFLPKASEFTLDKLPPGYRWISLENDGAFSTGVYYL